MADRETSVANWFATVLTSGIAAGDLAYPVDDIGTLTSPAFIVIDPDSATKREVILADGAWGGSSFVSSDASSRGLAGSASGAQDHDAGTVVEVRPLAQHIEDLHDRIDAVAQDLSDADFEATIDRVGATEGDVPTLQGDGTLAFDAVEGGAQVVTGSYAGDGTHGRIIATPFDPSVVIVIGGSDNGIGVVGPDASVAQSSTELGWTAPGYTVVTGGFEVWDSSTDASVNANGETYYYMAIG